MHDLPFSIPESLASYVVQFESDPDKTVRRLKKQLGKRGPDPVGYFLLGWFYYRQELNENAIDCALKAKTFAPGSPFFDKLHYFFKHPDIFDAWRLSLDYDSLARTSFRSSSAADPILDLNSLIEKLSAVDSRKLRQASSRPTEANSKLSTDSEEVDDIASETIAQIHEQQGKLEAAITVYKRLKQNNPEKIEHYDNEIERLQIQLEEEQEKESG